MLADNLQLVQQNIEEALGRRKELKLTGSDVNLVAVTKNHLPQVVTDIQALGNIHVGENRVQEAMHKQELLGKNGVWHLIGHLQTNKAKQAVAHFDLIESVDSLKLLQLLNKEAGKLGKVQDVLLQLNIAKEEQKSGFAREEYLEALRHLEEFTHLHVRGLMVIAQATENVEETRPVFAAGYRAFVRLREQLPDIDILSMGMSHDYTVAIEEGANYVRVGTALFGPRDYSYQF